jgi:hypothetical protein
MMEGWKGKQMDKPTDRDRKTEADFADHSQRKVWISKIEKETG